MERRYRRYHWLEKLQLQVASAASLAVVYIIVWPYMRGSDPQGAMSFLANGSPQAILAFTAALLLLAAVCAIVTVNIRPCAAMIALLIGLGGLSLRSGQMRSLLWDHNGQAGQLFWKMAIEVIVLAALVLLAEILISLLRALITKLDPKLGWSDPLVGTRDSQTVIGIGSKPTDTTLLKWVWEAAVARAIVSALMVSAGRAAGKSAKTEGDERNLGRTGSATLVALILAVALMTAFLRSADRGQILFALVASFFLAVLVAHQLFATRYAAMAWVLPMILAICAYALAGSSAVAAGSQRWMDVRLYARILPIDWLTAGCGGAMLGYWVSSRLHETRCLEKRDNDEGVQQNV